MKLKKRVISLLLVFVLVFSNIPFTNASEVTELVITDEIIGSITEMEYGWDGTSIKYPSDVFKGIAEGDNVRLEAIIQIVTDEEQPPVSLTAGTEVTVEILEFILTGEDAEKYMLADYSLLDLQTKISITRKNVVVSPKSMSVFYGQPLPEDARITELESYTDQLVADDDLTISGVFEICDLGDGAVGTYKVSLVDELVIEGESAVNYNVTAADGVFEVKEYVTETEAIYPDGFDGDYNGINELILSAPTGFLIGMNDTTDAEQWAEDQITVEIRETQEGSYSYYLRNNDPDSPQYLAICRKDVQYASIQTLPEITGIVIEAAEEDKNLFFNKDEVLANGNLNVTVRVIGAKEPQTATIYLTNDDGSYMYTVVEANQDAKEEGRFVYEATFTLEVAEGESKTWNLSAYATTSSGRSEIYPQADSKDKFQQPKTWGGYKNTDTPVTCPLTIDKVMPVVNFNAVEGNYYDENHPKAEPNDDRRIGNSIRGTFGVDDLGSGIEKIEYLWDDHYYFWSYIGEYSYVNYNWPISDYREIPYDEQNPDREYELILAFICSAAVEKDMHTLHVRVTDRAGNVAAYSLTGDSSGDNTAPVVSKVEIKKIDDAGVETNLVAQSDGIYHAGKVKIIIYAEDLKNNEEGYLSGMNYVKLSKGPSWNKKEPNRDDEDDGDKLTLDPELGAYGLVLEPQTEYVDLYVTVVDNSLNVRKYPISDLIANLENGILMLESTKPSIDFGDTLSGIRQDPDGNYWFGSGDLDRIVQINVTDEVSGSISSGLRSVLIRDNGVLISSTGTHKISELSDGTHMIWVTAADKCGNMNGTGLKFGKDTGVPVILGITANAPNPTEIDGNQWFLTDDITMRIDAADSLSGLASVKVTVNGITAEFSGDEILSDDQGQYVLINVGELADHTANQYDITAVATDYAGNTADEYTETVYVDREAPKILVITAEKSEMLLDQILNFLTFGLYSNEDILFKVYASDTENESGLGRVTVSYDNTFIAMTYDEEGYYYWKCAKEDVKDVFQANLTFTIYDKIGRSSLAECDIQSATEESDEKTASYFVMIEQEAPTVSLQLPATDVINDQITDIWYSTTEEKVFTLTVQDIHSGLRDISFKINGTDVLADSEGSNLVTTGLSMNGIRPVTAAQTYRFNCEDLVNLANATNAPADGKYVIDIVVTDNAGNRNVYPSAVFYMDLTNPEIKEIEFVPETADGISGTTEFVSEIEIDDPDTEEIEEPEEVEYGYFFSEDFNIVATVSDATPSSGLYVVNYRLVPYANGEKLEDNIVSGSVEVVVEEQDSQPGDDGTKIDGVVGKAVIPVEKGFMGKIYLEVLDNVNRTSTEKTTKGYVVDATAPYITIRKDATTDMHDAHGNPLYVQGNQFTVTINDPVAGLKQISYLKEAERDPHEEKIVPVGLGHRLGEVLAEGWIVTGVNGNLVTQIQRTFTFDIDDNNVQMEFSAKDNANNVCQEEYSEVFTVDKTAPIIHVIFREDDDNDAYYNHNRVADIIVTERNFDSSLIKVLIQNTFGDVPGYTFVSNSSTEHIATIDFDEGDYTLEVSGLDLGDHEAVVNYAGGNEQLFYVDKTLPKVEHNFSDFINSAENSFNVDKTATITVTEHNFDPNQTNLVIRRKNAGAEHNSANLVDVTTQILAGARWSSNGDVHTISFCFDQDAVYYIEIQPVDLASNRAGKEATEIFEIDKTVPVVSKKNGKDTSENDVEFLDIYGFNRKDAAAPTVDFRDLNISHIEYTITTYIPEYIGAEIVKVEPKMKSGVVNGNHFELTDFVEDGIYAVKLVAVDVAGNQSLLNVNTYGRMIAQDVLAYILDSDIETATGLYSLEYENGDPISKRPSDFEDLKIFVLAVDGIQVDIVLRGTNGDETVVDASCATDDSIYGIDVLTYTVDADFFKESFREDTDKEMQLTVRTNKKRIDLASIHIDNIAPSCTFPEELQSWSWFVGDEDRVFTITDISEYLVQEYCKVYDNGTTIPFVYSSEDGTLTFTLSKGWHNIGVILSDAAGNENIIQERNNVHIGHFWSILFGLLATSGVAGIIGVFIFLHKRKQKELQDD